MESAVVVGLLWLLFGGAHIGLASRRIRAALVGRLGERGFELLFSVVASLCFASLVSYYARHRFAGIAGPSLAELPLARAVLSAMIVTGITLIPASLWVYPGSADAAKPGEGVRPPRGIYRITRHPFFAGVVLIALAHALLATRLVGTTFFAGFLLLATLGPWHQRHKKIASRGKPYADYLAATSAVPFAAILAGRQPLAWRELPFTALAVGLALAWVLSRVHGEILAHGGVYVIVSFVGGAALLLALEWRRAHRQTREPWWTPQAPQPTTFVNHISATLSLRRALALCGGAFVAYVGLCHEVVGLTLFPDAPAFFGSLLAFHLAGVAGIALGLAMVGSALGWIRLPLVPAGIAVAALGAFFVIATALRTGGFHFFAFTLLLAGTLVALASREAAPRASSTSG